MALQPPANVEALAVAVLNRLRQSPNWSNALSESMHSATPTLVQHLDRDDEFYYLVAVTKTQGITARLAISEDATELLEAECIWEPGTSLPSYVDPLAVLDYAAHQQPAPGFAVFRPEMVGRHPVLVWKPCQQSTSRFLPFWLVTVRDRLLYIRVDGAVFTQLTTTPHG
jgi:hypothetical protein